MSWQRVVHSAPRRNGKTTMLAKIAKILNGTLICFSAKEALRVNREHGCKTASVFYPNNMSGRHETVIFEPEAVAQLEREYEARVDILTEEVRELRAELSRKRAQIAQQNTLFEAIAHGDENHREWLKAAITAHFERRPIPPVTGNGTKEKLIKAIKSYINQMSHPHLVCPELVDVLKEVEDV